MYRFAREATDRKASVIFQRSQKIEASKSRRIDLSVIHGGTKPSNDEVKFTDVLQRLTADAMRSRIIIGFSDRVDDELQIEKC